MSYACPLVGKAGLKARAGSLEGRAGAQGVLRLVACPVVGRGVTPDL